MVEAECPVASESRLAALPVGAASAVSGICGNISSRMKRTIVVLPVPGPPVRISTLCCRAAWIA